MFEKIYNLKNKKKGFTLVELIIVLVILAILLAVLVPSMTQWIKKAKGQQVLVNARTVYLACQTVGAEKYGVSGLDANLTIPETTLTKGVAADDANADAKTIAELAKIKATCTFSCTVAKEDGSLSAFSYTENNQTYELSTTTNTLVLKS